MARYGRRRPTAMAIATLCAMTASVIGAASCPAEAFDLKHDSKGQTLRWAESTVAYVVDPSIEEAVPGGGQAASNAVSVWSGTAGGPALTTVGGAKGGKPGLDGKNLVLLAPDGFAPAGNALAVTITSYDAASGTIVDADVVINGIHKFAVLAAGAEAPTDAPRVLTDGASTDKDRARAMAFDLAHVVSHEVGHTLGLADERSDDSALMYAFTTAGEARARTPSVDDVGGVEALYGMSGLGSRAPTSPSGCGQASVAGSRAHPEDACGALALFLGASAWLASRRSAKTVRLALPLGAALVALLAAPAPARSAEAFVGLQSASPSQARERTTNLEVDTTARVVEVSTSNVGGLFETTVVFAPTMCQQVMCPRAARAHTWGGTLGGITQIVGGASVPSVGDLVQVSFPKVSGLESGAEAVWTLRH